MIESMKELARDLTSRRRFYRTSRRGDTEGNEGNVADESTLGFCMVFITASTVFAIFLFDEFALITVRWDFL